MPKQETNIPNFKINYGTYQKIQENLSQIGENELIITSDKNIPIPTANDAGKVPTVNNSGEFELVTPSGGGDSAVYFTFNISYDVITSEYNCSNFSMTNAQIFQAIEEHKFIYGVSYGTVNGEWILSYHSIDGAYFTAYDEEQSFSIYFNGNTSPTSISVTDLQGPQGEEGPAGIQGEQGLQGPQGDPGIGVPSGGTTGQVLAKASGSNYDTEWVTPSSGSGNTDLTISVDSSTFDIVDITDENGNEVDFVSYATALGLGSSHNDLKLVFTDSSMALGGIWHLEGLNANASSEITGVILFRNSSINETGIISIINTVYSNKFPADTTDLLIKWKREYDSDEDNYVESFEWVPVCNQSKVIVPLGLQSLMAFNNIITAFMTEAVPSKLGQFIYAETSDTFTERSDILAYLNAGKEVWLDLGSNFNNMKLLINKYTSTGFGFSLEVTHYTITVVGDTYSSVNVEVYPNTIYAQGFVQAHST